MPNFHATPSLHNWSVRKSGGKRALKAGLSRMEAWSEARRRARGIGSIAYLYDRSGRIVVRHNYV